MSDRGARPGPNADGVLLGGAEITAGAGTPAGNGSRPTVDPVGFGVTVISVSVGTGSKQLWRQDGAFDKTQRLDRPRRIAFSLIAKNCSIDRQRPM